MIKRSFVATGIVNNNNNVSNTSDFNHRLASILRDEEDWDKEIDCLRKIASSKELPMSCQTNASTTSLASTASIVSTATAVNNDTYQNVSAQLIVNEYEYEDDIYEYQDDNMIFDYTYLTEAHDRSYINM